MLSCLYHIRGAVILAVLVFTSLDAVAQTQQPALAGETSEASKTGSITGRVVNEGGQPLPDAIVSVRAFGSTARGQTAITDRDGNFKVSGLERVPYLMSALMPAHTTPPREPDGTQATQYRVGDSVTFVLIKGGVITGRVTTAAGDPVVSIGVRAQMIRDANGRRLSYQAFARDSPTDDRGIYRIYGLPTGTYIVVAGGTRDYSRTGVNAFDTDVPTYAPSSTRDTAAEISVRGGDESNNVDIGYRGEPGRTISGVASGTRAEQSGFNITLTSIAEGGSQWNTAIYQEADAREFVFNGIADGDYYLTAHSFLQDGERAFSESRLIKVRGADIAGIELTTRPLGSISGRVVLEESKATECNEKGSPVLTETLISAWHNENQAAKNQPQFIWAHGAPARADPQGNIALKNLAPGEYYFVARFSAKYWYLQSISVARSAAPGTKTAQVARPIDAARTWTTVKPGDRISGLTITLAQGAASLRGQLALGEGETLPEKLFVYLVPAEREKADDVLRFFAVPVTPDGKIALNNLAAGRYWVLAQPAIDGAQSPLTKLRLPDATETRAKLRRDAEAEKNEIELKPCQNVVDFRLRLNASGQ